MKFDPTAITRLKPGVVHIGPETIWRRPTLDRIRAPQLIFNMMVLESIVIDYLNGPLSKAEGDYERRVEELLTECRSINQANALPNPRSYVGWWNILARGFQSADQLSAAIDAFVVRDQRPTLSRSKDNLGATVSVPKATEMFTYDTDGRMVLNPEFKPTRPATHAARRSRAAWALMLGLIAVYSVPSADGGPLGQQMDFLGSSEVTFDWWSMCDSILGLEKTAGSRVVSLVEGRKLGAVSNVYVHDIDTAVTIEYYGRLKKLAGNPSFFAGDDTSKSSLMGILKYWVKRRLAKERGASVSDATRDAALMSWASIEQALREVFASSGRTGEFDLKSWVLVLPDARDGVYRELGAQYLQEVKQWPDRVISNEDRFRLFTQNSAVAELNSIRPKGKMNWLVFPDVLDTVVAARGTKFVQAMITNAAKYASMTYRGADATIEILETANRDVVFSSFMWPIISFKKKRAGAGFTSTETSVERFATDEPVEMIMYADSKPTRRSGLVVDSSFVDIPSHSSTFLNVNSDTMGVDDSFLGEAISEIGTSVALLQQQLQILYDRSDKMDPEEFITKDAAGKQIYSVLNAMSTYQPFTNRVGKMTLDQGLVYAEVEDVLGTDWLHWFGVFLNEADLQPVKIELLATDAGLNVSGELKGVPLRITVSDRISTPASTKADTWKGVGLTANLRWLITSDVTSSSPRQIVPLLYELGANLALRGHTHGAYASYSQALGAPAENQGGFTWSPYYAGYDGCTLLNSKPGDLNSLALLSGGEILSQFESPNLLWTRQVLKALAPLIVRDMYLLMDKARLRRIALNLVQNLGARAASRPWLRGLMGPSFDLLTVLNDSSKLRLQLMNPSVASLAPSLAPIGQTLLIADLFGEHPAAFFLHHSLKKMIDDKDVLAEGSEAHELVGKWIDELEYRFSLNKDDGDGRVHLITKDYGSDAFSESVYNLFAKEKGQLVFRDKKTGVDSAEDFELSFGIHTLFTWWMAALRKALKDASPFMSAAVSDDVSAPTDRLDKVVKELLTDGNRRAMTVYSMLSSDMIMDDELQAILVDNAPIQE